MSTCWKCGRDLPDGTIECVPACGLVDFFQAVSKILEADAARFQKILESYDQPKDKATPI